MAKAKTKVSMESIFSAYTDYVLEHGEQPKSVYTFTKLNGMDESDFYQFFGGFEAIEKMSFSYLFNNTIQTIEKSKDYKKLDARGQLLTFYYTLFENLTANRSYIKYILEKNGKSLKNLSVLKDFRSSFRDYIQTLEIEKMDIKMEEKMEKAQDKAMQESAWIQFLLTLKFWLDDSSASFEKTDIFIEKSVNTSFDLMDVKPIKSLLDFGKFVLQEKTNFSTKSNKN